MGFSRASGSASPGSFASCHLGIALLRGWRSSSTSTVKRCTTPSEMWPLRGRPLGHRGGRDRAPPHELARAHSGLTTNCVTGYAASSQSDPLASHTPPFGSAMTPNNTPESLFYSVTEFRSICICTTNLHPQRDPYHLPNNSRTLSVQSIPRLPNPNTHTHVPLYHVLIATTHAVYQFLVIFGLLCFLTSSLPSEFIAIMMINMNFCVHTCHATR